MFFRKLPPSLYTEHTKTNVKHLFRIADRLDKQKNLLDN
jgi:hypothetical protein